MPHPRVIDRGLLFAFFSFEPRKVALQRGKLALQLLYLLAERCRPGARAHVQRHTVDIQRMQEEQLQVVMLLGRPIPRGLVDLKEAVSHLLGFLREDVVLHRADHRLRLVLRRPRCLDSRLGLGLLLTADLAKILHGAVHLVHRLHIETVLRGEDALHQTGLVAYRRAPYRRSRGSDTVGQGVAAAGGFFGRNFFFGGVDFFSGIGYTDVRGLTDSRFGRMG